MTAPALELIDVRKTFHVGGGLFRRARPVYAVNGVSLAIGRGEVLGLVGESGCGKSTLAKILLGLLAPSGGEVRLYGKPIGAAGRKAVARRIQPVFQDPYASLNPRKSVGTIVALPLLVHGIGSADERRRRVAEMLDVVGLPRHLVDAYPNQLSGGQRQRVAIARALAMRPEIVICDEPTSALDVSVQAQIINLLMDLRREFGLTYLLISHNLAIVEHLADRVAVMYLGRIVEERPAAELFRAPRHPYTRALLDAVLTPEPGLGLPGSALGGAPPNPLEPPTGCSFHPRCPMASPLCSHQAPRTYHVAGGLVECHLEDPEVSAA